MPLEDGNVQDLNFIGNPYITGIVMSLVPFVITFLLAAQYLSSSNSKSSIGNGRKGLLKREERERKRLSRLRWKLFKNQISVKGIKLSWLHFWKWVPRYVWVRYVECFFIPRYRPEWEKYNFWFFSEEEVLADFDIPDYDELDEQDEVDDILEDWQTSIGRSKMNTSDNSFNEPQQKSVTHDHSQCEIITFSINGYIFQTQQKNLARFPHTLLGNKYLRERYFDPAHRHYFLDRNPKCFEAILFYYQSGGILRRPYYIPLDIFMEEIHFYKIDDENIVKFCENEVITADKTPPVPRDLLKRKLWCLFDFPDSSTQARIVSFASILIVVLSLVTFCVETLPMFGEEGTLDTINTEKFQLRTGIYIDPRDPWNVIEFACIMWFCFEILVRFYSCPSKRLYMNDILNISDILSVVPWFVSVFSMFFTLPNLADQEPDLTIGPKTSSFVSVLKAVRLVRIFRILKLSRHSAGLKILGQTVQSSVSELILLVLFIIIGVILFSSMMYFAELGYSDSSFKTIPDGFWWGVCTMTTIGYGEVVPVSASGRLVGGLCAVAGALTIRLPMPVIVNNFTFFYSQHAEKSRLSFITTNHIEGCPYLPGGLLFHKRAVRPGRGDELEYVSDFELLKYENKALLKKIRQAKFKRRPKLKTKKRKQSRAMLDKEVNCK